ncbi:MAG: hypothetical protein MRZ79_00275 [Bacteroidia bacterium]|nr:hypothetical protein [Bacteroidia bacterium]
MMKNWKISVMVMIMSAFASMSFAQGYAVDTARLEKAEDRLVELLAVDKGQLTKSEKKAWKWEKKQQKRIIAQEMEKIRFNQEMDYRWRYGSPYAFGTYGLINPAFRGFYPYGGFYRRPVIVAPQRCVVPSRSRTRVRN